MTTLITPLLATLGISLLSFSGGLFLFQKKIQTDKFINYLVSFAAGVMLSAALLDLLPHAIEESDAHDILPIVLWAIVGSFLVERYLLWHHHHDDKHRIKPSAYLILVGDAIHNFVDGVIIAASFLISPALGLTTTLAIAAHEIPQELADFSVLVYSGLSKAKALLFNFLSSLTALFGTVVGWYFLESYEQHLPAVLAISAGMFIYIACADLIPELHREGGIRKNIQQTVPFVVGVLLMLLLTSVGGEH